MSLLSLLIEEASELVLEHHRAASDLHLAAEELEDQYDAPAAANEKRDQADFHDHTAAVLKRLIEVFRGLD